MNVFEFVFVSINGSRMPLSNYQGQPIFFVNTASECEYTNQYKELQRLWMDYRQSGLIVIGMPCDDFGHQEPGNEDAIAEFCETNYQVSFPMTGKYHVMGVSAHPLFQAIASFMNRSQRAGSFSKAPVNLCVMASTPICRIPRNDMHWCCA